MTELWQWFVAVGGGIVFIILVLEALLRGIKYLKRGKKNVDAHFTSKVKDVISEDRRSNCPWIANAERDAKNRELELKLLKDLIVAELQPIKNDISEIKDLTRKLHHSQMTDLQINLNHLYHEKFDKKGSFTKTEQSNWDKWYAEYHALGGNSDVKRMDDLIQATRVEMVLDKVRKTKESEDDTIES